MPSNNKSSLRQTNRNLRAEIDVLKAQIVQMKNDLSQSRTIRPKIDQMSNEVVDSNPYSRLMALQRMGVVTNYALYAFCIIFLRTFFSVLKDFIIITKSNPLL
ncbi:unnamed protein product [Schistosoma margrebowiei]|uniref:Uncharacterized protein n=1 Tax=Schistosoma margrebowiei TaxID=48269 RepID=A0A183MPS0_9TREM|nr:unnamed protein product [Schistosoma margrebowiei]